MLAGCCLRRRGITCQKRVDDGPVLRRRSGWRVRLIEGTEDLQMGLETLNRVSDQPIPAAVSDKSVESSIGLGEANVLAIVPFDHARHIPVDRANLRHCLIVHGFSGPSSGIWLDQQPQGVQIAY